MNARLNLRAPALASLLALLALLPTFSLVGCSDLGRPLKLLPRLELSAAALDFGTVVVNGSATRSVVVGNSGEADLHGFAAVSCPGYSIDSGGGAFTVPPAGQHTIVVRYQPGTVGSSPCELSLGSGLPPVPLSGTGALQAPGAACRVSSASLDLGTIAVGGSKLALFKVYSVGTAPVILDVVSGCAEFSVVGGGGARTLAPGDSLAVTLSFAPAAGGHFVCSVATGPGCPEVAVSGDATSVSFATQILPIFNQQFCNSCHVFQSTSDVVNVPAPGYGAAVRVKPFDTVGSVLFGKITNSGQYGGSMPQGAPLMPVGQRNLIRTWILEGARNN